MGDSLHYDRQGAPITSSEWSGLISTHEYRQVALDTVNGIQVATVWMGLDHNFSGVGDPLIFETMTFAPDEDSEWHHRCWRYSTEGQALAGHESICAQIRTGLEFIVKEEDDSE